jgi:NAD(P)-dependent dehydrogenase (short-subunit alcohol dehydrogenase family)
MRLEGKVAVITGSTRGIGRTMAEMFAQEGAKVAVTGRTVERGQKVVQRIVDAGGEAAFFRLDVTDEQSVAGVMDAVVEHFGSLTTLVNNAAPTVEVGSNIKRLVESTTEEWDLILRSTLTGNVFWTCKYGVPHLVAAGGGSIVNISSGGSVIGMAGFAAYSAAKGAMNSLTRTIAVEEAPRNIRCNAIVVGRVLSKGDTGAGVPSGTLTRLGQPQDIGHAAVFLASDESAFLTGSLVTADGGVTINGGSALEEG